MLSVLCLGSKMERKVEIMKKYFHKTESTAILNMIKVMVRKKILIQTDS
jgi:hypothetical protein